MVFIFAQKDGTQIYKTGVQNNPDFVNRLQASDAEYGKETSYKGMMYKCLARLYVIKRN